MADSMTVLRQAGPVGLKRNLVIIGDGFTAADQAAYNTYVDNTLMRDVFGRDYYAENAAAFNIYRINLESVDSGVSTHTLMQSATDPTVTVESNVVARDTALGMWFSGQWAYCWMDYGLTKAQQDAVEARIQNALNTWVDDCDNLLVVLNNPGFGGCGGGGRAHVTLGVGWDVTAHEFGHGIGGFADEYSDASRPTYPLTTEPGAVNVTINTDRSTLKWRQFVDPTTPVPTGVGAAANYNQGPRPATWDSSQDVGLFEGGTTYEQGVYRPVENCRMNGNSPPYCPVCYTSLKQGAHDQTGYHFPRAYAGSFLGSGRSDVLLHHGTNIQLFRREPAGFTHASTAVELVPGSWQFQPHDEIYVADVNGDGADEVVIFNGVDWAMPYLGVLAHDGAGGLRLIARHDGDVPGWGGLARNDKFLVTDLTGDGKADLVAYNTDDWSMVYVGLFRSTGAGFACANRFDGDIPGWGGLARHDQFFAGDFTGDGRGDLAIFNGQDWSMAYVGLFRSAARGGLSLLARYDGDIPGWGGLARNDQLVPGDWTGNGRTDLAIFNGDDWSMPYLGLFRSTGTGLAYLNRFDGDVPGWGGLARHDRFVAAKVGSDSRCDLWAWNHEDWSEEYLGLFTSTGTGFTVRFVGDWVGEWNLGPDDRFEVASAYRPRSRRVVIDPPRGGSWWFGRPRTSELYVHNEDWFGVISGRNGITLDKLYYRWIHDYRFGRNW